MDSARSACEIEAVVTLFYAVVTTLARPAITSVDRAHSVTLPSPRTKGPVPLFLCRNATTCMPFKLHFVLNARKKGSLFNRVVYHVERAP